MSLLEKLNWRYATKKFDHAKKLSATQLDDLLTAIQLAPSSFGLQPYKVLVIENAEIKAKLREAAFGQPQLTDSSHVIVFAAETDIDTDRVAQYIDLIAETRHIGREHLSGYEQIMAGTVARLTPEQLTTWAQKQAYIGLGTLLTVAADHYIDACPMEGFNAAQFNEILGLTEKGLTATVIAPIGFRAADDDYSKHVKVRQPKADFFIHF